MMKSGRRHGLFGDPGLERKGGVFFSEVSGGF